MSASFEDKVEALRRLKERREARAKEHAEALPSLAASSVLATGNGDRSQNECEQPLVVFQPDRGHSLGHEAETKPQKPDPAGPGGVAEADALFCAGHCHEHGLHGCNADLQTAFELYQLAAEDGHSVAQWRLGEFYEFGRGLAPDMAQAARWYRTAAEAGYAQAQSALP